MRSIFGTHGRIPAKKNIAKKIIIANSTIYHLTQQMSTDRTPYLERLVTKGFWQYKKSYEQNFVAPKSNFSSTMKTSQELNEMMRDELDAQYRERIGNEIRAERENHLKLVHVMPTPSICTQQFISTRTKTKTSKSTCFSEPDQSAQDVDGFSVNLSVSVQQFDYNTPPRSPQVFNELHSADSGAENDDDQQHEEFQHFIDDSYDSSECNQSNVAEPTQDSFSNVDSSLSCQVSADIQLVTELKNVGHRFANVFQKNSTTLAAEFLAVLSDHLAVHKRLARGVVIMHAFNELYSECYNARENRLVFTCHDGTIVHRFGDLAEHEQEYYQQEYKNLKKRIAYKCRSLVFDIRDVFHNLIGGVQSKRLKTRTIKSIDEFVPTCSDMFLNRVAELAKAEDFIAMEYLLATDRSVPLVPIFKSGYRQSALRLPSVLTTDYQQV